MSDSEFKKLVFSTPSSWKRHSSGKEILNTKYKPDVSFKKVGKLICILESTSTGDRKVNIGEMLQAEKAFIEENTCGYLVFSLCGSTNTSSTPKSLKKYLEPYFHFLKEKSYQYGIKEIYFINESELKEIGCEILSTCFKDKSEVLK